ncbi:MAG: DUF3397 domain-containing protein [Paenibacillaceae bacterium]
MDWDWLLSIYAIIATFAFLVFPLVWIIGYGIWGNKKTASRLAADITMVFLIGAVASMYDRIFDTSFKGFWIIVLFLLLLAGFIGNAQNRLRGKADPIKIGRAVWRLGFLVLGFTYLLFFLIGIIISIIQI